MRGEVVNEMNFVGQLVCRALEGSGAMNIIRHYRQRRSTIEVPFDLLRCQKLPFSAQLGFAGNPIETFPPYGFFELALTDRSVAVERFCEWMKHCLYDLRAWGVPQSDGGWAGGSLMRILAKLNAIEGHSTTSFEDTDRSLVDRAVRQRVASYFELFDSLRNKGYGVDGRFIRCTREGPIYFLMDGHHRASIVRALGRTTLRIKM